MNRSLGIAFLCTALVSPFSAQAFQWGSDGTNRAHVIRIEPSNMGSVAGDTVGPVYFQVDLAVGLCPNSSTCCPSGMWLEWVPKSFNDSTNETARELTNSKAILSTLQLALAIGYKIELYGDYPLNGVCVIENIHLLNVS